MADPKSLQPQVHLSGKSFIRPSTSKELLEAKVNHYESHTGVERLELFEHPWFDTCTGILYKGGTTKFKIVPVCLQLITIDQDFTDYFISVPAQV